MKQALIPLPTLPKQVQVDTVRGDLQVVGWDRSDASAKTDGDQVELTFENEILRVSCDGALILYMPRQSALEVQSVERDADLRALGSAAAIARISGDLQARNVGPLTIQSVAGDVSLRACSGDVTIANIGDDASLREVHGAVQLGAVASDLYLRGADGPVTAVTGGDAVLYLHPQPGHSHSITAGGDILLRVPSELNASLSLRGGSPGSIRIDLPGVSPEEAVSGTLTLGRGDARIALVAGGDVVVTSRAEEWESMAEFDIGRGDEPFPPGEFPGIPTDLHERIARRVEEATRQALDHSVRVQEHTERAQRKVEAAIRRAEEKMRAAERRASVSIGGRRVMTFERNSPPPPRSEPVADEERLVILRMLQEKKISLAEAEKLLAALEGK